MDCPEGPTVLLPPLRLPQSLDEYHGRFLVALAIRRQAKVPIGRHFIELLGRHLYRVALVEQELAEGLPLTSSADHSGYFKGAINGIDFFVPWHLVEIFPGPEALSRIEELSRKVQLDHHGSICLSGSGVFKGAVKAIADLDFCEYLTASMGSIPHLIDQFFARLHDIALVRIYTPKNRPSQNHFAPWVRCPEPLRTQCITAKQPTDVPVMMFEHIAVDRELGLLPVTNRVLPVHRDDPAAGHGQTTFVFQEVVFARSASPPRTLIAPLELGDYVAWLREQIRLGVDETSGKRLDAVKKLKRGLSLARLIHLHELAAQALTLLKDPSVERYVYQHSIAEIEKLINSLRPEEKKEEFLREVKKSLMPLGAPLSDSERDRVDADATDLVQRIGDTYDQIADEILQVRE